MIERFYTTVVEIFAYHGPIVNKGVLMLGALHLSMACYLMGFGHSSTLGLYVHCFSVLLAIVLWGLLKATNGTRQKAISCYAAITIILPTSGMLVLAVSAAESSVGTVSFTQVAIAVTSLFIYSVIVSNVLLSAIGFVLSFCIAVVAAYSIAGASTLAIKYYLIEPIGLWLTLILVTGLVNRNIAHGHERRVEAAKSLAGNLAHEMRTPLFGILARAQQTIKLMSELELNDNVKRFEDCFARITHNAEMASAVINEVLVEAARADETQTKPATHSQRSD